MLTDKMIREARPRSSVYRLRDRTAFIKGFGVVIAPSGSKTFFLSYTSPEDGKRKQISLGRYPATSLKEARLKAAQIRARVEGGHDPSFDQNRLKKAKQQQRELGSLLSVMTLYADDLDVDGKRSAQEVRRITHKDIPKSLLSKPAHLITKDDILDIITPIAQRGALVHADNVRTYLRSAFELALHAESSTRWRGKCNRFDLTHNPVALTRKTVSRKKRGQRALSREEVFNLWHTDLLPAIPHLALKLILATGQRVEEVLHAKWEEFDLKEKQWTIPGNRRKTRHHTNEPHVVPLNQLQLLLLEEINEATMHPIYLFPNKSGSGPKRFDTLTSAVRRFVERSKCSSFSPRDLRRTFKTLTGSIGMTLEIRNRLQGHAFTDVGSTHYDRWSYLPEKREAMERWSQALKSIVQGETQ